METQTEKIQEMFNKDLVELKNKEMKNTITEMKNTLEGINNRMSEAEEWINDLEDRMAEIIATEQNKEKRMTRNEDSQRPLGQRQIHQHSHSRGPRRRTEREKGPEKILEEIIAGNFRNMGRETVTQAREVHRVPGRINPRKNMPRHTVIKLAKIKDSTSPWLSTKQAYKNHRCLLLPGERKSW